MNINKENQAMLALNLHEKGLISNTTLLTEFGIDMKKEQELMKWEQDLMKQNKPKTEVSQNVDKIQLLFQAIEQARRNVEMLSKALPTISDYSTQAKVSTIESYNTNLDLIKRLTDHINKIL